MRPFFLYTGKYLLLDEGQKSARSEGIRRLVRPARCFGPVCISDSINYSLIICRSLCLTLISAYGRTMADEIIHEYGLNVVIAYLALPIIKQVLANGSDTTLIYVVYSVIRNRFRHIGQEKNGYETLQFVHTGVFCIMLLFGIADAGLFSYAQSYILYDDEDETNAINITNWYRNIHLSYITVYCTVTLEMFACALFIFNHSRPPRPRVSLLEKPQTPYSTNHYASAAADLQAPNNSNITLPPPPLHLQPRINHHIRLPRSR
jgi:hypothetical protein